MSVKVYKASEIFTGCSADSKYVSVEDYDKLEARCKELEEKIKDITSHYQPEEIAAAKVRADELRLKLLGEMAITDDFKRLEAENRTLKAQLEKCKEQRNKECKNAIYNDKDNAWRIENYDKELDSITIDSIKRGENE